jgi:hypothetical protein
MPDRQAISLLCYAAGSLLFVIGSLLALWDHFGHK